MQVSDKIEKLLKDYAKISEGLHDSFMSFAEIFNKRSETWREYYLEQLEEMKNTLEETEKQGYILELNMFLPDITLFPVPTAKELESVATFEKYLAVTAIYSNLKDDLDNLIYQQPN